MNRDTFFNAVSKAEQSRVDALAELKRAERSIELTEAAILKLIAANPVIYHLTIGRLDAAIGGYENRILREGHRTEPVDLKAMHLALAQLKGARETIQIPRPKAPVEMPSPPREEQP